MIPTCPECQAGKCRNCDGVATLVWNDVTKREEDVLCECSKGPHPLRGMPDVASGSPYPYPHIGDRIPQHDVDFAGATRYSSGGVIQLCVIHALAGRPKTAAVYMFEGHSICDDERCRDLVIRASKSYLNDTVQEHVRMGIFNA